MVTGYHPVEGFPARLEEPRVSAISPKAIVRYVDILYDEWFKKILGAKGNKDLLQAILQELIPERTIMEISYDPKLQKRKSNPFVGGHDAVFDVECKDKDGTRFVVEMQKTEQVNFHDRALFYSTFPIQEQVIAEEKGQARRGHNEQYAYAPVYVVSFLDFSLHKNTDRVLFRYHLREDDTSELMTDRINFIFLEMKNFKRGEIQAKDSFAEKISYAFMHMNTLEERPAALLEKVFERLFDACEIKRLSIRQQIKYKEEIMTTKMDRENILYTAELRGKEKGEKIGMEIGLEKGLEKGMEKGMEKGKHEALVQVAKRLLELGETIQFATEVTGLPADAFVDG